MPEFIENKPITIVFCLRKRSFWACFRENCVYKFGTGLQTVAAQMTKKNSRGCLERADQFIFERLLEPPNVYIYSIRPDKYFFTV